MLHYAKALSSSYDVIAIAVSGETTEELLVSHFLWKKEASSYEELTEDTRDFIRREIRQMPLLLREIGYELYHKSY